MTQTEDDFSDIDELMHRMDDLDYLRQMPRPELDRVIAYQRKQRKQREAGVKPRKPRSEPSPGISLTDLLADLTKTMPPAQPKKSIYRRR